MQSVLFLDDTLSNEALAMELCPAFLKLRRASILLQQYIKGLDVKVGGGHAVCTATVQHEGATL